MGESAVTAWTLLVATTALGGIAWGVRQDRKMAMSEKAQTATDAVLNDHEKAIQAHQRQIDEHSTRLAVNESSTSGLSHQMGRIEAKLDRLIEAK